MKRNIDTIVQELIKLDPDFMNHKKELKNIINKIVQSKPDIKIDSKFRKELKELILEECTVMDTTAYKPKINIIKNILLMFGGAAIASLVIIPSMLNFNKTITEDALIFEAPQMMRTTDYIEESADDNFEGMMEIDEAPKGLLMKSMPAPVMMTEEDAEASTHTEETPTPFLLDMESFDEESADMDSFEEEAESEPIQQYYDTAELISIAENHLTSLEINLENYEKPEIEILTEDIKNTSDKVINIIFINLDKEKESIIISINTNTNEVIQALGVDKK